MTDEPEDGNVQYGLLVSFEDQSDSYVHGFEAGMLSVRMKDGTEAEVEATIHTANKETVSRMAIAYGWSAEFKSTEFEEWTTVELVKQSAPQRVNPHGLRVVS